MKILLVCAAGMSTSLLVRKMKEEAKIRELDCGNMGGITRTI